MRLSYVLSLQKTSFEAVGQGDWRNYVPVIGAIGFDGVEFAIKDPEQVDLAELDLVLKRSSLQLVAIGTGQAYCDYGLSLASDDISIQRQTITLLEKQIELAGHFNALVIIGLIRGKLKEQKVREKALENFKQGMIEIDACAQHSGVVLTIEPLNRYEADLLNTAGEAMDFIQAAGLKNTGVLLDTFHMNIEEANWEQTIKTTGKYIKHVHIADSNRWYPGSGHIDFRELMLIFSEAGYDGFFSGEMMPLPDLERSIQEYYDYMRSLG
jgi:sugar phosphate isomerase/epimerase